MDSFFFRSAFFVFFVLLAGAQAQAAEPPVAVQVQGLPTHMATPIREHAAKGLTELRRYLERTRMIHLLRIEDIVRPTGQAALAMPAPSSYRAVVAKAKD